MIIRGSDVILYLNDDANNLIPICHSRTCTLTMDRDILETSGPEGPDRRYLPSYKGGSISSDGVVVFSDEINMVNVLEWLQAGNLVYFKFATSPQGGLQFSGQAYVQHWEYTGDNTAVATYSFNGPIDGPLVVTKAPIIKEVYLSDLGGVRLPGCPNPYPCMVLWYDGTIIGLANNADDVMTLFNSYEGNQYYQLVGTDTGCNFTMSIAWNSPDQPDWVPAEQGAGFVLGETGRIGDNNVIGQTGQVGDNNVIGPIQTQ